MRTFDLTPKHWEFDQELKREVAWYLCPFCEADTWWDYIYTGSMHIGCKHVVEWDVSGTITFTEDVI